MRDTFHRRDLLGLGALTIAAGISGCQGRTDSEPSTESTTETEKTTPGATGPASSQSSPSTPLNGAVQQRGDLTLSSPAFEAGQALPTYAGRAKADENPPLSVTGVPDDAVSLVLAIDDPDAQPVAGHTFNHWTVWNIDPAIGEIPRDWRPDGAVEGYNDFVEQGYGGPAPPERTHTYRLKLLALDTDLKLPPEARKTRIGSAITFGATVLGATQITGTYSPDE